jgi:signal transduction histidine kinase
MDSPTSVPLLDILLTGFVLVADVAITAVFTGHQHHLETPGPVGYSLIVIGALGLLSRRRWPMQSFTATLAVTLVYFGLGYVNGPVMVPSIVALYTVALLSSRYTSIVGGVVAIVSIVLVKGAGGAGGWVNPVSEGVPAWVAAALFLGWAVKDHRAYIAAIEDRALRAEQFQQEHARRLLDAQRLQIARDVHDVISHSIAMITLQAGGATAVLDEHPEQARAALLAIQHAGSEALGELRAVLGVLRDAVHPEPREPSPGLTDLEPLVTRTGQAGLELSVSIVGEPPRPLPVTVDLAGYRIIQEGLTNILRHAGSVTARVSITYANDEVLIQLENDAAPLSSSGGRAAMGAGRGITGMQERAASAGGSLQAGPMPDGGFRVAARLPARQAPS